MEIMAYVAALCDVPAEWEAECRGSFQVHTYGFSWHRAVLRVSFVSRATAA